MNDPAGLRRFPADVMRDNWQLATVLQFASSFSPVFGFPRVHVDVIEKDLEDANESLVQLPDLVTALADAAGARAEVADLAAWCRQPAAEKIADMYSWMLTMLSSQKVRDALEAGTAESRVEPIGTAGTGKRTRIYYLLDDNRIYYTQGERWKCVAWDVDSWRSLIDDLEAGKKSKAVRELAAYLRPVLPIVEKYHRELATDSRRRAKHRRIAFQVENRKRSSRLLEAERVDQLKVEAAAFKVEAERERHRREAAQEAQHELENELNQLRQQLLEHEGRVTRLYEQRSLRFRQIAQRLGVSESPPQRPTNDVPNIDIVSSLKI